MSRRDWTYSFIRNASTLPQSHENNLTMIPPSEPNTTILKLSRLPGRQYTAFEPAKAGQQPIEDINDASDEGKALLDFMTWISKQPGYESMFWGQICGDQDHLLIFIGWEENPSPGFRSSTALAEVSDTTPLAALRYHIRDSLKVTNIAFWPLEFSPSTDAKLSYELITWVIPSHLDPTYHQSTASQFDNLKGYFSRLRGATTRPEKPELAWLHRGWIASSGPAATEPSEKTHVFCLCWWNRERESRYKELVVEEGQGESWKKDFLALQQDWEGKGMRIESVYLHFAADFDDQLQWIALQATLAKRKEEDKERQKAANSAVT